MQDFWEEQARREVGSTQISHRLARAMTGMFLGIVLGLPLLQVLSDWRRDAALPADRMALFGDIPAAFFVKAPDSVKTADSPFDGNWLGEVFARNRVSLAAIARLETWFEEQSVLRRNAVGPMQEIFFRTLAWAGESVIGGRDGWLFLADDFDYLLAPDEDPQFGQAVESVGIFADWLRKQGIELVVLPVPVKPSLDGRFLRGGGHFPVEGVFHPAYDSFVAGLRSRDIAVLDAVEPLRAGGGPAYLKTDSHWTPAAMQRVAGRTAALLRKRFDLVSRKGFTSTEYRNAVHRGDLAALIRPDGVPGTVDVERTTVRGIRENGDGSARPEVVVLGDSFTNIFELERMGWGRDAGFGSQLRHQLGVPTRVFAQNGDGAYASRERFLAAWQNDPELFSDVRVVVWQFSRRELTLGDWKHLPESGSE